MVETPINEIGSMITGLQTMPSIAWFPLAIVLFKLTNAAVFFVVVLGAAPSIANGLLNGVDNIPPILLRAGRVLGAKGWARLRYIVVPAAFALQISDVPACVLLRLTSVHVSPAPVTVAL